MEKKLELKIEITGMSCAACENLIEENIGRLDGVLSIDVDYISGQGMLAMDETRINLDEIASAIESLGYQLGAEKKEKPPYVFYVKSFAVIASLALIFANTIGFESIQLVSRDMSFGMLFFVGMVTSIHCVAMCGGISLSQSLKKETNTTDTFYEKMKPSIYYNLGRLVSYTILGGLVGALGSLVNLSLYGKSIISVLAGCFMLIMGMNMMGLWKQLANLLPRLPKKLMRKLNIAKRKKAPFVVGLLNGLMPCGPLQAMQVYALGTGSAFYGALSMFLFSLGTIPLMLVFGLFGSLLRPKFAHRVYTLGAMFVLILGVMMTNRGLLLSGMDVVGTIGDVLGMELREANVAILQDEHQEVQSVLASGSYEPLVVYQNIPVKWTIEVSAEDLNGCNNEIIIPEYHIQFTLVEGTNLIEFTPTDAGRFVYTCWMGMIASNILVQSI